MGNIIDQTYKDIKDLRIQGAKNVCLAGLDALERYTKSKKWKTRETYVKTIEKAALKLCKARPTEPGLRNATRRLLKRVKSKRTLDDAIDAVISETSEMKKEIKESLNKIIEIGIKRIPDDGTVFTHCHSSTVTSILKAAWKGGKRFKVMNTETRPRFQGRITAKELAKTGIPVIHVVDSAARFYMNDADLLLVGGDAVTADGFLINKIGTSQIMLVAREARTTTASAVESFKFDPITISGDWEPIEMRSPKEVWRNPPKGVKILNPAFDMTPPQYIDFMITEMGIISPYQSRTIMGKKWGFV